ncbi:MAG: hypothetical protein HYS12_14710 [Planctomycetes bacterium]|nr:hypothetical protein [Planctomycetota bacterium]
MSLEHRQSPRPTAWPLSLPATIMAGALLVALCAALLAEVAPNFLVPFRVVLLVGALGAAGLAVWWRLGSLEEEFEERIWAALLVAGGAGVVLCCREAMDEDWDSLRMALRVFTFVAMVGVVVVLLPRVGRRVVASLLVLFHFGGILTAVTAVAPHNGAPQPWLPTVLWTLVYRPYLQFAYLNNAYHFYSPEPGPPTLVWFRVEFEDKSAHWYKLVNRDQFPTRLQYQRMLALTESTNQFWPGLPSDFEKRYKDRVLAGNQLGIPAPAPHEAANYYRMLSPMTEQYLPSYVRHVARVVREEQNPNGRVHRVQIYRLAHNIPFAKHMAGGKNPLDKEFYQGWFLGVFTPDGDRVPEPDPFTNWMLWGELLDKHINNLARENQRKD